MRFAAAAGPGREEQSELRPLTSLRFFGAVLVFVYHCPATSDFGARYGLGQAGVGFFFVLSGFILMYAYRNVFRAGTAWPQVRNFYAARVARVYPAYVLASVIALPVLFAFGDPQWNTSTPFVRALAFGTQMLMIQAWIPVMTICFGINSPAWSLSTEALFYVLFPLLAHSFLRIFGRASGRTIFAGTALLWGVPTAIFLIPHAVSMWASYIFPPVRLVDFAVGMLCAVFFLRQPRTGERRIPWTGVEAAAIGAVATSIALSPALPEVVRYSLYLIPAWSALIVSAAYGAGLFSRLLAHSVFVHLGRISFAFYLLHGLVIDAFRHAHGLSGPLLFAATFAVVLAASSAMYHLVERPLRGRVRRLLSMRSEARGLNGGVRLAS
jgi:peptidoglycan/LPS O-acetylase OafA/YrhL